MASQQHLADAANPEVEPLSGHGISPLAAPRLRSIRRFALAAAIAAGVVVTLHQTGMLTDTEAALQVMGFDPDRARLLADLVVTALAAAAGTLVTGAGLPASLAGMTGGGALFARTFLRETRLAIDGRSAAGAFDPAGWVVTLLTVVVALAVTAWAASSLAGIVRRGLIGAGRDVLAFLGRDRRPGRLERPAVAAVALVLLVVALPIFGDMVNYEPDVHMTAGRLAGATALAATGGTPSSSGQTGQGGNSGSAGGPQPTAQIVPGTSSNAGGTTVSAILSTNRPWAKWVPTGQGTVVQATLPAPWTGTSHTTTTIDIYTPPGYTPGGRAYPVVYTTPWALSGGWTTAVNVLSQLDTLITTGRIPATIFVFITEAGGPYPDSECANSTDGREWIDTFMSNTVVGYVDRHFHTIPTAAARAVLGFSAGGYCASALVLRHPDVFSTAISISGYYQAGVASNQTPNAWRPFGQSASAIAAYSPLKLVGQLPAQYRSSLFLIMQADATEAFYGPQYTAMVAATRAAGVNMGLIPSSLGHEWAAVRQLLPSVLSLLAERQAALGVFA